MTSCETYLSPDFLYYSRLMEAETSFNISVSIFFLSLIILSLFYLTLFIN